MITSNTRRITRKLLSLLLTLGMIFTMLPMSVWAEDTSSNTWTEVAWADITADDTIAITMTKDGITYVLPTAATGRTPAPDVATLTDNVLEADSAAYGWIVEAATGGIALKGQDGYLNPGTTNSGLRANGTSTAWTLDTAKNYLKAVETGRYLGVYFNNTGVVTDWRTYTSDPTSNNIKNQTLRLWKLTTGDTPIVVKPSAPTADVASGMVAADTVVTFSTTTEGATISYSTDSGTTWTEGSTYTVTADVTLTVKATLDGVDSNTATFTYTLIPALVPISTALAGAADTYFTVKGVVTMVDGRNIYVQDATGGICLYFDTKVTDLALGDTVTFTGKRSTYKGLPELAGQIYEEGTGLTLTANETTIGALTTADVCTYVKLTGLEVTAVDGTNIAVKDATGASIQIYKAVLGSTELIAGDVITFNGAVGIFNTTLQLRNTLISEIEVTDAAVRTPTASVAGGTVTAGTVVTFSTATAGAVIMISTDGGTTWTEGSTYTVNADVTLTVKAVLGDKESPTATFTYTTEAPAMTENDYGLASTLATGDKVILYNAGSGMGVGNTIASYKITGVALTPVNGVITTEDSSVVWTVTVNSDGTYTFTQGDYTLGGVVSGTKNNLVVTGATSTSWTPTGPDTADFHYYLRLDDMSNNYGKMYMEYYKGFTLYGTSSPTAADYGINFYKQGTPAETPATQVTGDLVTSLTQLTNGTTVAIYSPGHKTAISTKENGDWYLKANPCTIDENGKVAQFTSDFVWKVQVNDNGTYTFVSNNNEAHSITVWPSDKYAELTVDYASYSTNGDNTWTLTPAKTANCFYFSSPTISGTSAISSTGPAHIEAYTKGGIEMFSGFFIANTHNKFTEDEFALQFYLVNPDDAVAAYDDGEWDGVLTPGEQYVAYNANAASSLGLFKEANYALDAIPTTIEGSLAKPGNGAYAFTIGSMGRYYSFEVNGKYLATNAAEELFFVEKNADGTLPENAKWFLVANNGGYIIYNKDANYKGSPVCIEYYSSVFSGWTFKTSDQDIFRFNFYKVTDDTVVYENVVQDPSVIFDCDDSRYVEQDYLVSFSLDDLAPSITSIAITYTAGSRTGTVTEYEVSSDGKTYSFTIPAADIDNGQVLTSFAIQVAVTNSFGISYTGEKTVTIIDEPFFTELTPAPNSQTRDEKKPTISVKVGNAGENPTLTMTVNGEPVDAAFENGVLSYTPATDMADGRVTVAVTATRADNVSASKTWNFTVGVADYQLYFGQLHSHTTYSDGSGTLETALEYIESLPESANIQFVAFTDHSNYFDTTSAANPAASLNDKSQMTAASRELWEGYKNKAAAFNESHENLIALAGFEMTWSGGPGHINTFDSKGLVSRNNTDLNNKTGDAGMKLYYQTINQGDSINQFNHPGSTFGNFTDFSYWDEDTDAHMFLVEVGNGEGQIGAGGYYPSYEQYIIALDKGWHVAPTNNQDNHKGRWGNANDARDVILTNDFSEQGLYDAIRALRVYATEDKNLQINYTVNDQPMGTVFTDENAPTKLNVVVTLYDPDSSDSVSKVELVSNAGVTAYTWDNATDLASGQLTVELDPTYSYYFVRVTQSDGDLAVTAPVWVGQAAKLGIESFVPTAEQVYINEETTLTTTLFNNETAAATVKSLTYTINGGEIIGTDTNPYTIPAGGTVAATFAHTFTQAKLTKVTVTAVVELDGKEYTYTANVELDLLDRENENTVTPIAQVRAASVENDTGYRFIIEGVVTSNASDYDKDTAFFDCIYVQDETGGICCFPVSGNYKIGDKVHIVGHTDFYQGEPELQVQSIELMEGTGTVEPTAITAAELNDRSAEGKLVTVTGTVDSFELANGLIQTIMIKDANGDLARVFIDGYITKTSEVVGCEVGASVTATGLASYDDTFNAPDGPFPRIRIRDRADVVCTPASVEGYHILVTDCTAGNATTSIEAEALYSGEVTFTVSCAAPCVVAVDNGNDAYTVLTCATSGDEHSFTVTVTNADVTIVIAVKGDANLNGAREAKDATFAAQAVAGKRTFTALQQLAMDGNGDGVFDSKDATFAAQVESGKRSYKW